MYNLKKVLLSVFLVVSTSLTSLQASNEHNLTDIQLHAVMGIITNFILSSSLSEPAIIHNGTTYKTVTSPYTGKVWLDRNLGASQVCTGVQDANCYGDYYQWGRSFDRHQEEDSNETNVQAIDIDNPGSLSLHRLLQLMTG